MLEQLSSQDPAAVERSLRQQEELSLQNQMAEDRQKRTDQLVFEVPEDCEDFALAYQEEFENGDTGDVFFVYFSVE